MTTKRPLSNILSGVVGGVIVLLIGDNPFVAYYHMIGNSFGSLNDIGYTLFIATPLIFTGLAVAVAFRCGLLNIGAEGQLYVAAFFTAWVGIKFGGTIVNVFGENVDYSWTSLPAVLLVPMCILAAIIAGGVWGAVLAPLLSSLRGRAYWASWIIVGRMRKVAGPGMIVFALTDSLTLVTSTAGVPSGESTVNPLHDRSGS
mgnify:CR=1 FL=1